MKKLTIALVAHDNRKADMVEWAIHNAEFLSHHHIVCTCLLYTSDAADEL